MTARSATISCSTPNRGGLFVVSDNVYKLFRSLELVTRKLLTLGNSETESLKDRLMKHISGSVHVQNMWCKVAGSLDTHLSEPLFSTFVNYWVKIRISLQNFHVPVFLTDQSYLIELTVSFPMMASI